MSIPGKLRTQTPSPSWSKCELGFPPSTTRTVRKLSSAPSRSSESRLKNDVSHRDAWSAIGAVNPVAWAATVTVGFP